MSSTKCPTVDGTTAIIQLSDGTYRTVWTVMTVIAVVLFIHTTIELRK